MPIVSDHGSSQLSPVKASPFRGLLVFYVQVSLLFLLLGLLTLGVSWGVGVVERPLALAGPLAAIALGYNLVWLLVAGLVQFAKHSAPGPSAPFQLKLWQGYWLYYHRIVFCGCLLGGLIGGLGYVLVGSWLDLDKTLGALWSRGVYDGSFYLLIWGPGSAMVLTVWKACKGGK